MHRTWIIHHISGNKDFLLNNILNADKTILSYKAFYELTIFDDMASNFKPAYEWKHFSFKEKYLAFRFKFRIINQIDSGG